LIRGILGGKSSEYQGLIKAKKQKNKNKLSLIVKRVQQFFDEL
jgi:predicted transcriptional regulator